MDRRAIEALGAALEGSDRTLLVTSGVALLAQGRVAIEEDAAPATSASYPRASEAAAAAVAARGVRAAVVRLPPSVHGHGDHGLCTADRYRAGEGRFRVCGGRAQTAGRRCIGWTPRGVYRLAFEQGAAGGPYHAIAEEGVALRDIAELIGRRLDVPVVARRGEEAAGHFGWFTLFAGIDAAASSARTRARLGWQPTQPGLLEDIENAGYFER
ncbi:MAG: hypothetical protein WDN04_21610 [Rhodospirillales bacterium]